jgi:CDP-4-dehydro-6-deoxyglucose reductase, E1
MINKKIYYGKAIYGKEEINASIKVLRNSSLSLMDGKNVKKLEEKVSKIFGKKFGLMVNSGSSANLLGLASLNLKEKSEVITPSLTFSTTISPLYHLNLIPRFIDVKENFFVANVNQIEKSINKNTSAIMIPNLLGNIPDWIEIYKIAKKYKLKIIEDSADTIGYTYKKGNTGKYSDVVTNSFYASHIVTGAGFGGIVCFNDVKLYNRAKLLRGWGRSSANYNESEGINERFNCRVDNIPYDSKYVFKDMGYNFLPSEISATFALEQIKKLKKVIDKRVKNFETLKNFFKGFDKYFKIPDQFNFVKTAWLAYPIVIKNNSKIKRRSLQIFLEENGIQTRTIFTGNIMRQPIMKNKLFKKNKDSNKISDDVMKNGLLIGCHHGLTKVEIDHIFSIFKKFLKKNLKQ